MPRPAQQPGDKWEAASRRLARLFREERAARGLTQEGVARAANLSLPAVRKIEKSGGVGNPGLFTVFDMVDALGIDDRLIFDVVRQASRDRDDGVPLTE